MAYHHNDKGKRLSVLTDAEKFALYGLPDFDEGQQLEFLSLSARELELATSRPIAEPYRVYGRVFSPGTQAAIAPFPVEA